MYLLILRLTFVTVDFFDRFKFWNKRTKNKQKTTTTTTTKKKKKKKKQKNKKKKKTVIK